MTGMSAPPAAIDPSHGSPRLSTLTRAPSSERSSAAARDRADRPPRGCSTGPKVMIPMRTGVTM